MASRKEKGRGGSGGSEAGRCRVEFLIDANTWKGEKEKGGGKHGANGLGASAGWGYDEPR